MSAAEARGSLSARLDNCQRPQGSLTGGRSSLSWSRSWVAGGCQVSRGRGRRASNSGTKSGTREQVGCGA